MKKIFTFRMPTELHRTLELLAAENQRSMSGHLRWLIANNAARKETPHTTTNVEEVSDRRQDKK